MLIEPSMVSALRLERYSRAEWTVSPPWLPGVLAWSPLLFSAVFVNFSSIEQLPLSASCSDATSGFAYIVHGAGQIFYP